MFNNLYTFALFIHYSEHTMAWAASCVCAENYICCMANSVNDENCGPWSL